LGRVMAIRAYGMAYSVLLGTTNVHMPAAVRKGGVLEQTEILRDPSCPR